VRRIDLGVNTRVGLTRRTWGNTLQPGIELNLRCAIDGTAYSWSSAWKPTFPDLPVGTVNHDLRFERLVVVMMENHSFDNLTGALARDRPQVDGLTFQDGVVTDWNPGVGGMPSKVTSFALKNTAQGSDVYQTWQDSHEQINGGSMDGFVRTAKSTQPMGYYTSDVLPFAYSLASTFTVGNRWFSSLPGPTYPNRRFLLAGTAYGTTVTAGDPLSSASPASGTIFGLMSDNDIDWSVYFSEVPMSMVIGRDILLHGDHHHKIDKFFADCKAGNLPQVSFVDPKIGLASKIGKPIADLPSPFREWLESIDADLIHSDPAETEEDPQDMYYGELWAYSVVQAVIDSPQWAGTCLIYIYDEHGGYYDHVAPPASDRTRRRTTRSTGSHPKRRIHAVRPSCTGDHRLPLLGTGQGGRRRTRPHVCPRDYPGEVEPARSHQA
jgi:phospholipase C